MCVSVHVRWARTVDARVLECVETAYTNSGKCVYIGAGVIDKAHNMYAVQSHQNIYICALVWP